jgi:hypothetical protein
MKRRKFTTLMSLATSGMVMAPNFILKGGNKPEAILGHGEFKYKANPKWGTQNSTVTPVNDCHEMVQDKKGRLILLTNETKNNVIIYDRSGKVVKTWGDQFPGAHGLTLVNEGGEEFLFITDHDRSQVYKTTLDGKILMTLNKPLESGKYLEESTYKPTEVTVLPNGDFYVADGYGSQYITHYNYKGEFLNIFGGRGEESHLFKNAHGVCYDDRDPGNPVLLITARVKNALKRFTLDGEFIEDISLPGAYIGRPVIDEENVYLSVLVSKMPWDSKSGFVIVLDKNNKVVSVPGGNIPAYEADVLQTMSQTHELFQHPHDVCVDSDKNLFIPQWNSGKTYPIKLERV